jgi:hypothetical protein
VVTINSHWFHCFARYLRNGAPETQGFFENCRAVFQLSDISMFYFVTLAQNTINFFVKPL